MLINEYVENTYSSLNNQPQNPKYKLKTIIKLDKDSVETFRADLPNRHLLFHGSRTPNFLGILA
jgi:hypothetical protein